MNQASGQHVERKYLFSSVRRESIVSWLEHACLPDTRFPRATVSSIYFDTPSLALYWEKRNGDWLRCKIRLRWYDDDGPVRPPAGCRAGSDGPQTGRGAGLEGEPEVRCFLEAKRKEGLVSHKTRLEVRLPRTMLEEDPFSDMADLAARAGELGHGSPGPLVATLLIRYRRWRFLDPRSLARIAIDSDIRCTNANTAFVPGHPPVHLDVGVLEIKGRDAELPASLYPLWSSLERGSFSKYAACLELLLSEPTRRL